MPQGQCTLPPDETGRILDRLAGLEQIIPPEAVRQALAGDRPNQSTTLQADPRGHLLGGPGHGDLDRVADPPGLQARPPTPRRRDDPSSVQPVRGPATPGHRPGPPPVRADRSSPGPARDARGLLPRVPPGGPRWHGLRRPRLGGQRRGLRRPSAGPRGDGAFPQIRKLSLVELGTHVELAFVVRSIAHGEQSMVGGLLRHLTAEMLLLWDRGFLQL